MQFEKNSLLIIFASIKNMIIFLAICLRNMILYWLNAMMILKQLSFIFLLVYLGSNRSLKRSAKILFSLRSAFLSYFLVFEAKKVNYRLI